jgi:RimJ/RimL family protein N-acetyltransferase
MDTPLLERPVLCLPRTFVSKPGVLVHLQRLRTEEQPQLLAMYLAFQPRNAFQGLPPIRDEVCAQWVADMVRNGLNVAAWSDGRCVIAHTALFPVNQRKAEMLVAVSPEFQNFGIGTELVRACVDLAAELGFERIWLPVDATNVRARHVYEKCGFRYVSSTLSHEVDMVCDVAVRTATSPRPPSARAQGPLLPATATLPNWPSAGAAIGPVAPVEQPAATS